MYKINWVRMLVGGLGQPYVVIGIEADELRLLNDA